MLVSIQDPFSRFEFGLKAEETRKKYVRRLEIFFDFHEVEGETIKEKAQNFFKFTKENGVEGTTDLDHKLYVIPDRQSQQENNFKVNGP